MNDCENEKQINVIGRRSEWILIKTSCERQMTAGLNWDEG
jgi:hypothetical protein